MTVPTSTTSALTAPVLTAQRVGRTYRTGAGDVTACAEVSLQVPAGSLLVVRGPSGSGKTSLLNLLGGIDRPDTGRVLIDDVDLTELDEEALAGLRRDAIGFVFQSFGLLPMLTAAENVEVPLRLLRRDPAERDARVDEVMDLVGLSAHQAQRPGELSGGQQQRVGIARALAVTPRLLVADEPTGQLDSRTAASIMDLIVEVVHDAGVAAVVATHDQQLVERADAVVTLHDGRVVEPDARSARPSIGG